MRMASWDSTKLAAADLPDFADRVPYSLEIHWNGSTGKFWVVVDGTPSTQVDFDGNFEVSSFLRLFLNNPELIWVSDLQLEEL